MRRLGLGVVVAVALGLTAWLGAAPAVAYPDVTCHITDPGEACGGDPLTLHATVDPAVDCTDISITWRGMSRHGTGSSLTAVFPTKKTKKKLHETDTVSCTYTDPGGTVHTVSATGRVIIFACNHHKNGNGHHGDDDDDDDGNGHGHLPNTGGERLLWLIIAGLLLVGGGVTVASARNEEARPNKS